MLPAMTATALLLNYGAMFELIAELNKEWRLMISTRLVLVDVSAFRSDEFGQ